MGGWFVISALDVDRARAEVYMAGCLQGLMRGWLGCVGQ